MKIVTSENFDACVVALDASRFLSCDTETTGLYPWKNDRLFSIQFSDAGEDYYFNFVITEPRPGPYNAVALRFITNDPESLQASYPISVVPTPITSFNYTFKTFTN